MTHLVFPLGSTLNGGVQGSGWAECKALAVMAHGHEVAAKLSRLQVCAVVVATALARPKVAALGTGHAGVICGRVPGLLQLTQQ